MRRLLQLVITCMLAVLIQHSALASTDAPPLVIRGDSNYPPYEFMENGIPTGFNVDIMRAVAQTMNMSIKIDLGPWQEVRSQLEAGDIAALTGMYQSAERARTVSFSSPHLLVTHALFVRRGSTVQSLDDLAGRTVLVQHGDIMHDFAISNLPQTAIQPFVSQQEVLLQLAQGKGDAALIGRLQGQYWTQKLKLTDVYPLEQEFSPRRYCLAVTKGNDELLAKLNEGLALIKQSGEYDAIHDKWFGVYSDRLRMQTVVEGALWVVVPLCLLLLATFCWTRVLQRKVNARTRELTLRLEEHRKTAEALAESEARYRSIFESMMDGYYRTDMTGKLIMANPAAAKMLGYDDGDESPDTDIATAFYAFPEARTELLRRLAAEGQALGYQATLRRRDGSFIEVESNCRVLHDPATGEMLGVEGVFRDVTARKRMEDLMLQTEKMVSVGGLAAGMAHEINNPLSIIASAAQNIQRRIAEDLPGNVNAADKTCCDLNALRRYCEERNISSALEAILEASRRAGKIVANMLDFTRRNNAPSTQCDPAELAHNAIAFATADYDLKKKYDFKRVELITEIAPNIPPIICNKTEIEQVILNLLRNAAQALATVDPPRPDPRITLRVQRETQVFDGLRIEVEDNGPGMSEAIRKRIFEPFFTTKAPGEGTGLGLSVSYFIVTRNHGGSIHVDSTLGEGTRFTLRLPQRRPKVQDG